MASYGKKSYWNDRYTWETEPCDWITTGYDIFQHHLLTPKFLNHGTPPPPGGDIIVRYLNIQYPSISSDVFDREVRSMNYPSKEKCRVLNVGCGNSQLSELMVHDGWFDIVNIDYSEVVINKMNDKYDANFFNNLQSSIEKREQLHDALRLESRDDSNQKASLYRIPKLIFEVGDITEGINHPDESFDLIICKKTLDIVLCGAGSIANAKAMMTECYRLLNMDHGVMMILSTAKPENRAFYFEQDPWSGVEYIKLTMSPAEHDHKKGHERKKVDSYVYFLYKQSWRHHAHDI